MIKKPALFYTIILLALSSCSKKTLVGHYTTNPENKAAFAGRELTLNKDGSFIMNTWTDSFSIQTDENGNVICNEKKSKGHGTYKVLKDALQLSFTNEDFVLAEYTVNEITTPDSTYFDLEIHVTDELGKPLHTPRINIINHKGNIERYIFCQGASPYNIQVIKKERPQSLLISMFGSKDLEIKYEDVANGSDTVKANRCRGYYANGTVVNLLYKLTRKGIEYQDEQGNTHILAKGS